MSKYSFSDLRQTSGYRLLSYHSYVGLILFYFICTRISNVFVFFLIMFFFIGYFVLIGGWIFIYTACTAKKQIKKVNRTNIIHDIGVSIFFASLIFIWLALFLDKDLVGKIGIIFYALCVIFTIYYVPKLKK